MAANSQQFIVDEQGRKTAVVLPIRKYEKLMADLHDLAIVAERKDEEPISLAQMRKRLKRNGVL